MGQSCSVTTAQVARKRNCVLEAPAGRSDGIDGDDFGAPWGMGQTCSVIQAKPARKRNCLLDDTDDHDAQAWSREFDKACSKESLDPAREWAVGSEFEVTGRCCTLRSEPCSQAKYTGVLKPGMAVVLLKVAFDDDGNTWGLLNPPVTAAWLAEGWAVLEGATPDVESQLYMKRLALGWEIGQAYRALEGTIVREHAEISSCQLCILPENSIVEVLEFAIVEGKGRRMRLRTKVLRWSNREVGWLSPRSEDGVQLLMPMKEEKLEMCGRAAHHRHALGGA